MCSRVTWVSGSIRSALPPQRTSACTPSGVDRPLAARPRHRRRRSRPGARARRCRGRRPPGAPRTAARWPDQVVEGEQVTERVQHGDREVEAGCRRRCGSHACPPRPRRASSPGAPWPAPPRTPHIAADRSSAVARRPRRASSRACSAGPAASSSTEPDRWPAVVRGAPGQQGGDFGRDVAVGAGELVQLGFVVDAAHPSNHAAKALSGRRTFPRVQPAAARALARRSGAGRAIPARHWGSLEISRHEPLAQGTTRTSPVKSATHLPSGIRVGQTDRMMTEAEALKTLAREDPAVAEDAKAALRSLTSGGGLGRSRCCGCRSSCGTRCRRAGRGSRADAPRGRQGARPAAHAGRHGALRETSARASRPSGSSPPTPSSRTDGVAAYSRALAHLARGAAGHRPARLVLGRWARRSAPPTTRAPPRSSSRSPPETCKVGVSGWKTKRAGLVERWLTRPTEAPGTDTWLSRISAERIEEWAHGHPGERSRLARAVVPRLLEPPDLPGEPLPTLRLAARPRRRRAAADRPALHRAVAGRRGGRAVRLGRRRARQPVGQAAPGTRRLPAAHPARARAARDGRGAAQRHQPWC